MSEERSMEILKLIYNDLLSPSFKNLGKALGTVVDLANVAVMPIELYSQKQHINLGENLKKYGDQVKIIASEKIIEVPSEIANPILNRFLYVTNEQLSEVLRNLLINASSSDTIHLAHPGFISIVDRLSADEIRILAYFQYPNWCIPHLSLQILSKVAKDVFNRFNMTGIDKGILIQLELLFPQNTSIYFENLISLGLLKESFDSQRFQNVEYYKKIETLYELEIKKYLPEYIPGQYEFDLYEKYILDRNHSYYEVTDFGRLFIKACIEPINL